MPSVKKTIVTVMVFFFIVVCGICLIKFAYYDASSRSYCSVTLPQVFEHKSDLLGDEGDDTPCKFALGIASTQVMEKYALAIIKEKTIGYPEIPRGFLREARAGDDVFLLPNGDGLIARPTASDSMAGELLFYNRAGCLKRREVVEDYREWRQYLRSSTIYQPTIDSDLIGSQKLNIGRYTVYMKDDKIALVVDWWLQQTYTGEQQEVLMRIDPYPVLCQGASLQSVEFAREQQHKR